MSKLAKPFFRISPSFRPLFVRRAYASVLDDLPLPPSRSIYRPSASSDPSPIPTSSRTTLTDPLFSAFDQEDPVISSLAFASDEDLINAVLGSRYAATTRNGTRSVWDLEWTAGIDASPAFLCLRSRPAYSVFLRHLGPQLDKVYRRLRGTGLHQLLASDLMLRNPDGRLFRRILELDVSSQERLRPNVVRSMYAAILPRGRMSQSLKLSKEAKLLVVDALIEDGETEMIVGLWHDLLPDVDAKLDIGDAQVLLDIVFHLTRHQAVEAALPLLRRLVERSAIPPSALESGDSSHPVFELLLVRSVALRACLVWKLYDRALMVADEILETLETSGFAQDAYELLLSTCRFAIVGRDGYHNEWALTTIRRLAALHGPGVIPESLADLYYDGVPPSAAVELYSSLPLDKRPAPSPQNIVRMAETQPLPTILHELYSDFERTKPVLTVAQREPFLTAIARAGMLKQTWRLYNMWAGNLNLSRDLLLAIVRCAVPHRRAFFGTVDPVANRAIQLFTERLDPTDKLNTFALALARHMSRDRSGAAQALGNLHALGPSNPEMGHEIERYSALYPVEVYDLLLLASSLDTPLYPPTSLMVEAYRARRTDCLFGLRPRDLPPIQRREMLILKLIQKKRFLQALKLLQLIHTLGLSPPPSLYRLLAGVAGVATNWRVAIVAWLLSPKEELRDKIEFGKQGVGLVHQLAQVLTGRRRGPWNDVNYEKAEWGLGMLPEMQLQLDGLVGRVDGETRNKYEMSLRAIEGWERGRRNGDDPGQMSPEIALDGVAPAEGVVDVSESSTAGEESL